MDDTRLILDCVYDHEAAFPERVFLTQPIGGGQVVDITWGQALDQARRMAAHLKSLGFEPGARIAMLAKNSAHFIVAELAIWMAGGATVAIFPTETADNVRYVLEHCDARLLFVGKLDTWSKQASAVPAGLPCIALPLAPETGFETWDAIVARTPPLGGRPARAADDLAMLLYTSGSTGQPKGVMQNFGSITRAAAGISANTRKRVGEAVQSRMISYLPLAHSFERSWVEAASLYDGNTHLYFTQSLDTFLQDLRRARPTLFLSVPRLWLKFQQGVFVKIPPAKLDRLLGIPLLGRIVARKVLAGLGLDAVVQAGSGSAPLPPELILWYRRLGLRLYEGYGMTEDNSYSHTSDEQASVAGWVGKALDGVQVRLDSDGEILIKSPGQFSGYYKQPELTAESFTEDGFFRTGDLGERNAEGLLKLTGRKKELFKTAKGEYVAPAPIENRLNAHPMVELAMVSGLGQPAPYAVVILDENLRPRLGDPELRARVDGELAQLLHDVNDGLAKHEQLQFLAVAPEPWTIDNGCLTPTMKIKRSRIEAMVARSVDHWYTRTGPVLWVEAV